MNDVPDGPNRFRKLPVEVEAVQWTGENEAECIAFCPSLTQDPFIRNARAVPTLEGEMRVSLGDWIIRGVKGEFYPCKPDIFALTYEQVGGDET